MFCLLGFLILVSSVLSDSSMMIKSDENVGSTVSGCACFSGLGALLCVSEFTSVFFVSSVKRIAILGMLFFF